MKDETVYLKHIRDALAKIESYTAEGRKQQNPEIPWRSIIALRNVLIHEYFRVDLELVWRIVRRRLPTLKRHIETILTKSGKQ